MGALAIAGAAGGVALANALPERALEISFAVLQFLVAAQLVRRAFASTEEEQTA
jgi:uncharacterized membrane protein YfcA